MGKNMEQLAFWETPDPIKVGTEWMREHYPQEENSETKPKGNRRKVASETYAEFIRRTKEYNLDPNTIFASTDIKRNILSEVMGYERLVTSGNKRVALSNASNAQIGRVFQNTYQVATRSQG